MEWRDEGILLRRTPHGERDAILDVLTAQHGRARGLVRGGASRRRAAEFEPGAQLQVRWRARLEDHLGTFEAEASQIRAGRLLDSPIALAALSSACAMLIAFLPERDPEPRLYAATLALADALGDPALWPEKYASWEMTLLSELGFGLDLASCAATGSTQELVWVSPRSGRAVSRAAGAPYADRLLPLPAFLRLGGPPDAAEFQHALRLTGHFLERRAAPALGLSWPPPARERLTALAARDHAR